MGFRGWQRSRRPSWPRSREARTGVVLTAVAVVLFAVLVPIQTAVHGSPVAITMLLGAAAVGAPLVALYRPGLAILLFTAAAVLIPLSVPAAAAARAPWPWSVPLLLAFAVMVAFLTFQLGWRTGLVQLVVGTAAGIVAAMIMPSVPSGNSLIVTTSVVGGIYLVAVALAGRLRLGEELQRERELTAQEQARREVVEERTRIARELHDVVAHSMSLIQVQAATARYRVSVLPPEAVAEFDDIARTARSSLAEMRRILGVLRTDDHSPELAPQRGVDDIPALIESTRRAGASVQLVHEIDGDVSPAAQIAAYRIVQEALSNAVRHSPGSPIAVSVRTDAEAVLLSIRNPVVGAEVRVPGGHGLRGMAERAGLLGGSVDASAVDGQWVVAARLPRHPAPPEGIA